MSKLALLFLLCVGVARADGVDSFGWISSPDTMHEFGWSLPSSIPSANCCVFTLGEITVYLGTNWTDIVCSGVDCFDPMTDYMQGYGQPILTDSNGMTTFIPGTYQQTFGQTDMWGGTLTIAADPPVGIGEPSTVVLLGIGAAVCIFMANSGMRKKKQVPEEPYWIDLHGHKRYTDATHDDTWEEVRERYKGRFEV